jgi:hypothetical protein
VSDALAELEGLLPDLPAAIARAQLGDIADRLATAFNDAQRQTQRLTALADAAALLTADKDPAARAALTRAFDAAKEAAEAMADASDAEGLRVASEEYTAFKQSLNGVDAALRPVWRTLVDKHFRPLASVGVMLTSFPAAKELGARMQQTGKEAVASAESIRPAEELAAIIKRLLDRRSSLLNEQKNLAGGSDVDTFLEALTSNRATLNLLTPDVLDWLVRQNALTTLKVTPA